MGNMTETPSGVTNRQIAMLIDGDNAQASLIESMLSEAGKYGVVTIRRIYGDWTMENMKGWKEALHVHAVQPIQQFRYTTGKNSTDSAMIIDAMDILYSGAVTGFCLVSSDSDYTRLAMRIREKGLFVMGTGKRTTPRAFVNACEVFVHTENLVAEAEPPKPRVTRQRRQTRVAEAPPPPTPAPVPLLRKAFEMAMQDDGWASLATMGNRLRQLDPSFERRALWRRRFAVGLDYRL